MSKLRSTAGHGHSSERVAARTGLLMTLPVVLYMAVWIFAPTIYGLWLSLTTASFLGPGRFTGLGNYLSLMSSPSWWHSVRLTVQYSLLVVPGTLILAFVAAYCLVKVRHGTAFFSTIFFLPYVVPAVAAAIVFELLLQPGGLVNQVFHLRIAWLTSASAAIPALSLATGWSLIGFYVVIFLAGFQAIPHELLDAAAVDGAGWAQLLFHVELPLLAPTVLFSTVTSVAFVLTNFTTVYVLTQGGPGNATDILPIHIYRHAFEYSQAGAASAMAMVLLVVSLALTAVQFWLFSRSGVL